MGRPILEFRGAQALFAAALLRSLETPPGFGVERYDIVLLSHVLHDESAEAGQQLIAKAAAALRCHGCLIVHEFALDPTRFAPCFRVLPSAHLPMQTTVARVYGEDEIRSWLRAAGFASVATAAIDAGMIHESRGGVAQRGGTE